MENENTNDVIIGIHSIISALKNQKRSQKKLFCTKEGLKNLKKHVEFNEKLMDDLIFFKVLDENDFQNEAQKAFHKNQYKFSKIPTKIFLEVSPLEFLNVQELYDKMMDGNTYTVLALDNVTDINNGAAILRTAAFYQVDFFLFSQKGSFGFTPSFYRIASGAAEIVPIVKCSNLASVLRKVSSFGIDVIGFAEDGEFLERKDFFDRSKILVIGSEDKGISHAVKRVVTKKVALKSKGSFTTLNASVAAAIAMERFLA